jgi:hypothetical protein
MRWRANLVCHPHRRKSNLRRLPKKQDGPYERRRVDPSHPSVRCRLAKSQLSRKCVKIDRGASVRAATSRDHGAKADLLAAVMKSALSANAVRKVRHASRAKSDLLENAVKIVLHASEMRNDRRGNVTKIGQRVVGVPGHVGVNAGVRVADRHVTMSHDAGNVRSDRGERQNQREIAIVSVKNGRLAKKRRPRANLGRKGREGLRDRNRFAKSRRSQLP